MPGLQTAVLSRLDEASLSPTSAVYTGSIDRTWCIGSVPQGGYSLSIILNAVLAFMHTPELASTNVKSISHLDPLLLSATYIQAVTWTDFEVRIHVLKRGKSLSNVQAELWQDGFMRITTQLLMTDFKTQEESADRLKLKGITGKDLHDPAKNGYSITEQSQWAPKFPLARPQDCRKPRTYGNKAASGKTFNFGEMITVAEDPAITAATASTSTLAAGAYYSLVPQPPPRLDPTLISTGRLSAGTNLIPFLADMFASPPDMIPGQHKPHWYPTLHLTIEFKRPLPAHSLILRTATYSTGRFMINGQHESNAELWSHPDDQHLFEHESNARNTKGGKAGEQRSYIIAIARQTALVLPFAINQAKTTAKSEPKANL